MSQIKLEENKFANILMSHNIRCKSNIKIKSKEQIREDIDKLSKKKTKKIIYSIKNFEKISFEELFEIMSNIRKQYPNKKLFLDLFFRNYYWDKKISLKIFCEKYETDEEFNIRKFKSLKRRFKYWDKKKEEIINLEKHHKNNIKIELSKIINYLGDDIYDVFKELK